MQITKAQMALLRSPRQTLESPQYLKLWDELITSSHAAHAADSHVTHRTDIPRWGTYVGSELVYRWMVTRPRSVLLARVYDVHDGEWEPGDRTAIQKLTKIQLAGMVAEWETPDPSVVFCWVCDAARAAVDEPAVTRGQDVEPEPADYTAERIAGINDALAKIGLEPLAATVHTARLEVAGAAADLGQSIGRVVTQLDLLAQQLDLFTSEDYLARLAK